MDGRLTRTQRRILGFIADMNQAFGYSPSIREISADTGLSASTVHAQLEMLERFGLLRRRANRARSLEVTPGGQSVAEQNKPTNLAAALGMIGQVRQAAQARAITSTAQVPLVGRIAAGEPVLSEADYQAVFELPRELVGSGDLFMLRVQGDSMIGAGILDGDCVVVRRQPQAANGDIVVALLDGETTVKELELKAGWGEYEGMRLLPANEAYVPIEVSPDRIVILGVVVTVLRRYYPRSGPGV